METKIRLAPLTLDEDVLAWFRLYCQREGRSMVGCVRWLITAQYEAQTLSIPDGKPAKAPWIKDNDNAHTGEIRCTKCTT